MTIRIPDTLTTDNSGKYIVSIRLKPDGLSFSGYIPSVPESFFVSEVAFERGEALLAALQEIFYAHEFLTWSYKEVRVVVCSARFTLIPDALYDEKKKEDVLSFLFTQEETRCVTNVLKEEQARLVFGMDNEVYEFCTRSFIHPQFIHPVTPLLVWWKEHSRTSLPRKMYVSFYEKLVGIICYDQGNLLFVNSFPVEHPEDALYYILYVWKQVGLDQEKDLLCHAGMKMPQIIDTLQRYLRHIYPVKIPSGFYLSGKEIQQTPIDLIALTVCEL